MDEMDTIDAVLDELGQHIAQELKRAFGLLREAIAVAAPEAAQEPDADSFAIAFGPVAPGTRGRACIEGLARLGGVASVPQLGRSVNPPDGVTFSKHLTRLRGLLRYLARPEHGYVAQSQRAVWRLTAKGRRVIEHNGMIAEYSLSRVVEANEKLRQH